MKKYRSIFLLMVIIGGALFVGCAEQGTTANLKVRLNDAISNQNNSRSMYSPIGEGLDIFGYILEGSGPNDQTLTITTSSAQVDINGLVIGTWTLLVTAINQQGTALATGEKTFQLSTKNNTVDVMIDTLIGSGSLDVTFSWGEEVFDDIEFTLGIKKQTGPLVDVSEEVTIFELSSSAMYEAFLDAGVYEMFYSIYSNGTKLTGGVDVIRILDSKETIANVDIIIKKTTPEATGLTIQNNFGRSIFGSITGVADIELPHTQITASFEDETEGPHSYQITWYLDGEYLSTGSTAQFSTYTGTHRLDAIAQGTLIGNMGSTTKHFKASVTQNGDIPIIVSSLSSPDRDKNNNLYFLDQITDSQFLRDGKMIISSSNGLQVCDVVNDELIILNSYTTTGNGISVASDPYPTQGVTNIAIDTVDDIVITTAKNLSIVVVYQYSSQDASLTKLGSFDPTIGDSWTSAISNVVLDKANKYAFFVNRANNKMQSFKYDEATLALYPNASLGPTNPVLQDASVLHLSNDGTKFVVSSPSNNVFRHYILSYKYDGRPLVVYGGKAVVSSAYGTLVHAQHVGNKVHVLTDSGMHIYSIDGTTADYLYRSTVGTTNNHVFALTYDNLYDRGWSVEMDSQLHIKTLSLLNDLSYDSGRLSLNNLSNVSLSYSPKGNMMSLTGSSSLYLLRLNDN
ncbi:MAG: hypothetical protein EOM67_08705 [Spirochaetia bacterium]|nr:hypothetical protein [Spirochaetia bacterium]